MAGGVGNRFWPVSTREKPKQFIDVLGCGKSLLQLTVEHFKGICPAENVWVVTSEEYAPLVREQLPQIDENNILTIGNIEPLIKAKWKANSYNFTIDLDVLDPSVFPGTGTPEAGGVTFVQLLEAIIKVGELNIVGCDINVLSPLLDASGASTAVALKVLRELLLKLEERHIKK